MIGLSLKKMQRIPGLLPRLLSLLLCAAVLLPMAPVIPAAAADSSVPYYQAPIEKLSSWKVMSGYPDGQYHPERPVTRAEFVAMVNRAYGYTQTGPTPFTDVPSGAWYADDIAIAYNAGYFAGTSASTASPNSNLTREQAMVLLAQNMRLETVSGEVTNFKDGRDFSDYSKGYVNAAVKNRLISGFPDGTFRPKEQITRGQMATILSAALGTLVKDGGSNTLGEVYGNLTINKSGTVLRDTTVAGNLYVSGGLGLGAVVLDNVQVLGEIVVAGGGVSESGEDSISLINVDAEGLRVDSLAKQFVSLRADGETLIPESKITSSAFLQDRTAAGYGLLNLNLNGKDPNTQYTLSGNLEDVLNLAPNSQLTISKGTVQSLTVDEKALNSGLTIDKNAVVKTLNLDTGIPVAGTGDVATLNVNANGSTISTLPDEIKIRPGVTANVAGTDMDTRIGEESSATPRFLAGYPKTKDVAPATLTAVFSCNKSGTVHWAVSAASDGSLSEEDLINPAAYGSKSIQRGTLSVTASNQEFTAKISGLTRGGSYYLSAVLVDGRGTRSPLKVIAFETPDDSTPAFASGYPVLTRVKTTPDHTATAQASVMATKSCNLYYVVLPKGAAAPTVNDFKSNYLPGSKGNGVIRLTKNVVQYFTASTTLSEITEYDLYLWLSDADGGKSSSIQKLSFKTPDGTAPEFRPHPSIVSETTNSLTYTCSLSEDCTVYWTAVKASVEYPKPPAEGGVLTPSYIQRVIASGTMCSPEKSGKVSAKKDTGVTLNINGLQPATAYYIYYVAQDAAGNFSEVIKDSPEGSFRVSGHTLDNSAPTVSLEFGYLTGKLPYVNLIFSEDVRRITDPESPEDSLQALYDKVKSADPTKDPTAVATAKQNLANALEATFTLYSAADNKPVEVRTDPNSTSTTWAIDYHNATVSTDKDGKVTVQFKSVQETASSRNSALNLNSGSTYYFQIWQLEDLSSNHNSIGDRPVQTDKFTTLSAQVILTNTDSFGKTIPYVDGGGTSHNVESDIGFSLTPSSTTITGSDQCWDLLLWTNSTVDFSIFRRVRSDAGTTPWEKLKSEKNPGKDHFLADTGYISLTRSFLESNTPETLAVGLSDQNNEVYEYVIHINELDESSDRSSWSGSVEFRASVLAGKAQDLLAVGAHPTAEALKTVTDISIPVPFSIIAPFMDTKAPYFAAEYPTLVPGDYYVEFNHQLNRSGTVYCVIAPLGTITDAKTADGTILDAGNYDTIPNTGIPTNQFESYKSQDYVKFPLSSPTALQIKNYKTQNKDIIVTKFSSGPTPDMTTIEGLQKNTKYVMYVAIESAGQTRSAPQAFRFETTDVQKPAITLTRPVSSHAGVKLDVSTEVKYILIRNDSQNPISLFGETLDGSSMTVLEALTTPYSTTMAAGTVFDNYATMNESTSSECRRQIQELTSMIENSSGGDSASGTVLSGTLSPADFKNNYAELRFENFPNEVRVGQTYTFLCMASIEGSGTAFAALRNISVQKNDPPQVSAVTVTIGTADKSKASGKITITLNDYLHNLQSKDSLVSDDPILQYVANKETVPVNDDYIALGMLPMTGSTGVIVPAYSTSTADSRTRTLEFTFPAMGPTSAAITLDGYIGPGYDSGFLANSKGTANVNPLRISLDLSKVVDAEGNTIWTATAAVNSEWSGAFNTANTTVLSDKVPVASIAIDKSYGLLPELNPGVTGTLTATVLPSEADQRIQWISSHPDCISIDQNGIFTVIKQPSNVDNTIGIVITAKALGSTTTPPLTDTYVIRVKAP